VQLAKKQGWTVVSTSSPKNFDYVRSLGADHVFDYRDPDVVKKIRETVPHIQYVFDTIGNETSSVTGGEAAAGEHGAVLCTVRPGKTYTEAVPKSVKVTAVLVFTAFLKKHTYLGKFHWDVSFV
jgi:NADPH:quinone reductase-like Zn-dependent oxidoreductase